MTTKYRTYEPKTRKIQFIKKMSVFKKDGRSTRREKISKSASGRITKDVKKEIQTI